MHTTVNQAYMSKYDIQFMLCDFLHVCRYNSFQILSKLVYFPQTFSSITFPVIYDPLFTSATQVTIQIDEKYTTLTVKKCLKIRQEFRFRLKHLFHNFVAFFTIFNEFCDVPSFIELFEVCVLIF